MIDQLALFSEQAGAQDIPRFTECLTQAHQFFDLTQVRMINWNLSIYLSKNKIEACNL